jgi:ABC-type bacteriocin/lantibiotic exporter with double-glycine peptidase domain
MELNYILNRPTLHTTQAGRTRVLITNQLHILHKCDHVVVMEQGRIVEQGTYAQLVAENDSVLSRKIASHREVW